HVSPEAGLLADPCDQGGHDQYRPGGPCRPGVNRILRFKYLSRIFHKPEGKHQTGLEYAYKKGCC
ncbi:MAG: hypothetical protein HKN67_11280, partial [Saprospiraceae bacterium]|nr:hypothetical protein [Saprospiraceae bacterium]